MPTSIHVPPAIGSAMSVPGTGVWLTTRVVGSRESRCTAAPLCPVTHPSISQLYCGICGVRLLMVLVRLIPHWLAATSRLSPIISSGMTIVALVRADGGLTLQVR